MIVIIKPSRISCSILAIATFWPLIILHGLKLIGTTFDSDLVESEVNVTVDSISSNETYSHHSIPEINNDQFVDYRNNKIDNALNISFSINERKARTSMSPKKVKEDELDDYNSIKRSVRTKLVDQYAEDSSLKLTRNLDSLSLELYEPQQSTLDGSNSRFIEYQNDGLLSSTLESNNNGQENTHETVIGTDRSTNQTNLDDKSSSTLSSSDSHYHWTNTSWLPGVAYRSLDSNLKSEQSNGTTANQSSNVPNINISLFMSTPSTIKLIAPSVSPTALGVDGQVNLSNHRLCSSPYNCHLHLNERCVNSANFNVCQCVEPFHRSNDSEPCRIKKGALITVSFGNLAWSDDLANIYSPRFIETKDQTERSLRVIMDRSPLLSSGIVSIGVLSFSSGSVLAKAMVHVRNELFTNNFKVNLAREMTQAVADLSETLKNEKGDSLPSTLLFQNVTIKAIQDDIDPCGIADLNYCSSNAICLPIASNLLSEPGFRCQCKSGYTDLSPNPYYPGEVCRVECPLSYCENGGHCLVNAIDSRLYCTCQDWNVGPRCQYSGILVFSVLGVVVILLMLIVACTTSAFCGKRVTRETVFSRRVSPVTYDETARPFRIAVNNYDSPEMTNGLIGGNSRRMDSSGTGLGSANSVGSNRRLSRGNVDEVRGKVKSLSAGGTSGFKDDCLSDQASRMQGLSPIGLTQANLSGNPDTNDSEVTLSSGNKVFHSSSTSPLNMSPEKDSYRDVLSIFNSNSNDNNNHKSINCKSKQNQQTQVTWF